MDSTVLDASDGIGEKVFFAFTNPREGQEDAFETWYDAHLKDITDVEGFVWGERLIADPDQRPGQATRWKYAALYGFEGDVQQIHQRLAKLGEADVGSFRVADAVHPAYVAWVYSRHQPLIVHESADAEGAR